MKPLVYTYQDPIKQTTYFRGYVRVYKNASVIDISCHDVRTTKGAALRDAQKLLITVRKQSATIAR